MKLRQPMPELTGEKASFGSFIYSVSLGKARSNAFFISFLNTRSTRHCSIFSVLAMTLITISEVPSS